MLMESIAYPQTVYWPLFQRILFRFFFIFFMLIMAPWTWLDSVPSVSYVTKYYYDFDDWLVNTLNKNIFQVREVLIPPNGSGDTSYGWAQLWAYLLVAFIGCIIWSFIHRKKLSYSATDYWLLTFLRYYISLVAFFYGIDKLFLMQMPSPSQSQLATPLGDLLPMRFSWLFIGYSGPYEFFSGCLEVLAGTFLLFRKTITLGLFIATGVFLNVMMLNLCYDIPVKIYSIILEAMCLYLLICDSKRLISFFLVNKGAAVNSLYEISIRKKWIHVARIITKIAFIILFPALSTYNLWQAKKENDSTNTSKIFNEGIYNVRTFVVNKDTIPALITDTLRWQNIIFEKGNYGSIQTADTLFRERYHRAYFSFEKDTTQQNTIGIYKSFGDSAYLFTMQYKFTDSNHIMLWSKIRNDSLYVELEKSNRHFQLAEKQFHWLSEANR